MMTDYLETRTRSIANSQKQQIKVALSNRLNVKNDNLSAASSSSLQMNRTGSAGAPSLPESPLARNRPAATGVSPRPSPLVGRGYVGGYRGPPLHSTPPEPLALARIKPTATGFSPSPLARRGYARGPLPNIQVHTPESFHSDGRFPWSKTNGEVASSVDLLEDADDDEGSDTNLLASYSLLGAKFDIASFSATSLDDGRHDGSAENSSIDVGKQTFVDGKRERIVIQVK